MRPVLTPAEASALDRACEERGISLGELMENAGRAVASAAAELCEGTYGRRAVILCGKGNNGGDGLVAARHLSRWGMRVSVLLLEPVSTFREPAAANAVRLTDDPSIRVNAYSPALAARELDRADVAVDAIFGTGFRGIPEDDFADAIDDLNASDVPVVAVDIPSGVNGGNGAVEGDAVWADVTVTFGAAKPGVVLFPGTERAGLIEVAGIGFPPDLVTSNLSLIEEDDVADWLPVREPDTHKKATGVVAIVGGSRAMTGAVCLAARAAYRAGAGLVTIAVPEGILRVVQSQVPEATFLPLPETATGFLAKAAFDVLWKHMGDFDAFAIGPGAGRDEETAEFLRAAACGVPEALVLDADGLNAFEGRPAELRDRGALRAVLTPHVGEFARLSGEKAAEIEADRIGSTRRLAAETQTVVLLKGRRTLIGEPGGEVRINATGSSALATAGSGDVLTGTTAALLARGLEPHDAASAAAFVHGVAGLRAAKEFGEGTTAVDVADQIAAAIKDVAGWVNREFAKRYRPTVVEVDLEAIRSNVRTTKPADAELMAVVKADGYGHGDVPVARAALEAGATWLGVALVEEGIRLREGGIVGAPILLLSEMPPGSERDALAAGLTPTIYTPEGLNAVAKAASDVSPDTPVSVHIKVDTGMHRVGLYPPEGLSAFVGRARELGLIVDGVWTHFARSEDDADTTDAQLDAFGRLVDGIEPAPRYLHASNSGATLLHPKAHLHLVRPGIAIYGLAPTLGMPEAKRLTPALTWRSAVTMTKLLPAGEGVSYGHTFHLKRQSVIATVPVGYADGYSRRLSNRAEVLIRGKRYPVAGNVTMDQVMIDCGEDDVRAGEEVVLLGRQGDESITAEELADLNGTLHYEILCGISERVPREYSE